LTTLQLPLYRKLLPGKTRGEKKRGKGIIAGTRKREKGKAKRPEPEPERVKGERGKPSKKKKEKGVHPQKLKNHIDQTERAAFESFASCDLTDRPRADRHTDRQASDSSGVTTSSHCLTTRVRAAKTGYRKEADAEDGRKSGAMATD